MMGLLSPLPFRAGPTKHVPRASPPHFLDVHYSTVKAAAVNNFEGKIDTSGYADSAWEKPIVCIEYSIMPTDRKLNMACPNAPVRSRTDRPAV